MGIGEIISNYAPGAFVVFIIVGIIWYVISSHMRIKYGSNNNQAGQGGRQGNYGNHGGGEMFSHGQQGGGNNRGGGHNSGI